MKELIVITGKDCPLCRDTLNMLEDLDLDSYIIKEKDVYETVRTSGMKIEEM